MKADRTADTGEHAVKNNKQTNWQTKTFNTEDVSVLRGCGVPFSRVTAV